MNGKTVGEIGQNVAVGELSKYGLSIAYPLGDNLPIDLVLITPDCRLYRAQVKTSSQGRNSESVVFKTTSNNAYGGQSFTYDSSMIDILIVVDIRDFSVYLFDNIPDQKSVTLRLCNPKNNQVKNTWLAGDYILSSERVKSVFKFDPITFDGWFSKTRENAMQYTHICKQCGKQFVNARKNAKFCGGKCYAVYSRKVERPSLEQLSNDIRHNSYRAVGRKYGVTDGCIKKWMKSTS